MKGNKLIDDHVQISVNLARFKSHGKLFEVVIDPDKVVAYKQGDALDIDELLQAQKVFADAKKGLAATEADLNSAFETTDTLAVAKKIIDDGDIQFTQKYRQDLREQKYNKVVHLIHRHAMNPQTGLPHPENRVRSAMQEANVHLNDFKKAEDQLDEVVNKLRPIMPISLERVQLKLHVPAVAAAKAYGALQKFGKLKKETWGNDGGLTVEIELPAGLKQDCLAHLQSISHGGVEIIE